MEIIIESKKLEDCFLVNQIVREKFYNYNFPTLADKAIALFNEIDKTHPEVINSELSLKFIDETIEGIELMLLPNNMDSISKVKDMNKGCFVMPINYNNNEFNPLYTMMLIKKPPASNYTEYSTEQKEYLLNLRINNKKEYIDPDDILYIKAERNYCFIIFKKRPPQIVIKNLKGILSMLNKDFLRVHKSYAVNLNYMKIIDIKKSYILMINSDKVPISRRNKHLILKLAHKV